MRRNIGLAAAGPAGPAATALTFPNCIFPSLPVAFPFQLCFSNPFYVEFYRAMLRRARL